MKNINPLLCILITFLSIQIHAQQIPHYTQYLYNLEVLNPAAVGSRSDLNFTFLSRQQWAGIEGAPVTHTFSANARTNSGLGIGTTIIRDEIGLATNTNFNIDASYTLVASQYGRLALGLKGGLSFFNNNLLQGTTPDNDIYASTSGTYPNVGLGVLYYTDKYFLGLSAPQLLKISQFNVEETSELTETENNANFFINGGIKFDLTENIQFKPSTLIKYNTKSPISIDFNVNFLYKKFVEAGISYRYNDAVSALIAFTISEKVRIGYSYDNQLTNFGTNLNAHELILRMDFDLDRRGRWLKHSSCYF